MNPSDILSYLVESSLKNGASAVDVLLAEGADISVSVRLGKLESLERSETKDVGLRLFIGKQQAIVSSSAVDKDSLDMLVERAISMAKLSPPDPFCGIADPNEITKEFRELNMFDSELKSPERLIECAKEAEESALSVDKVTNSEGASSAFAQYSKYIMASNGFYGHSKKSISNISVSAIAGTGTDMQTDYESFSCVYSADLPSPSIVGKSAGERAAKKLFPKKMQTKRIPVVFDKRISGELIGAFLSSISGSAIARGTSFLKDYLGKQAFGSSITITEDPFMNKGLRSRAFDDEGLLPSKKNLIENGVLTTWLLDLRSARQLSMKSTGNAKRSTSSIPSPGSFNVYMQKGSLSKEALLKDIKEGFYVTETMGMGINGITGDYSQAANGFWIENGEIAFPVNEMTIAGNLKDMFLSLIPADDLEYRYGIDTPTICIPQMTVAGT